MELNTLGELIRADDPAGPAPTTVDRLVTGALHRGRRTRTGRWIAAGVAGCALLTTGLAVAVQWPGRSVETGPVAPTATVSASPSESLTPSKSERPTPDVAGTRPPTQREVLSVLKSGLPPGFEISELDLDDKSLEDGVSTGFTVTDRAGRAWVGGGVQADIENLGCDPDICSQERLAGGTVTVLRSPKGEKAGDGTWYFYQRPDDRWVWFGQNNALQGKGPVTREKLPLSAARVRALLTAPEWDPLVARCAAAGRKC